MIGIRNFNEEILTDIEKNPFGYFTSLFAGLFTSASIVVTPISQSISSEIFKSIIAIITAILIVIFTFLANKIMLPIWEQKLKKRIYNLLKLK
jgi:hypothetical protein